MKKNFKYAIMAIALSMGMTSCSNNDDDVTGVDTNLPVESELSYATITLKSDAVTRAEAPYPATTEESKINTVKVYVFNSLKVLEQIETFTQENLDAGMRSFETSAGTHYFMAVANYPAVTVPIGSSMDYLSQLITTIDEAKFKNYINKGSTPGGFFMTSGVYTDDQNSPRYYRSIDYVEATLIPSNGVIPIPAENRVTVPIGRAMAKVNLAILNGVVSYDPAANGTIEIAKTVYTVANNPDQMYYFPYFGTAQKFQTPTYDAYNQTSAPTSYWPALHQLDPASTGSEYDYKTIASSNLTNSVLKPFYVMENSNKVPTYGNATIISMKTKFNPTEWDDDTNTQDLDGSFYRVYDKLNKEFKTNIGKKGFWKLKSAATTFMGSDPNLELVTYDKGVCYYIIPLKNKKRVAAPEWYDVIRNHFYDVVINKINGCGYNAAGGGDGPGEYTKPTDPLDPDTYNVEATVEVRSWIRVTQTEEIGIRPN